MAFIFAFSFATAPVYAEETIEEPGTGAGSEWDGAIKDPTPTPAPTPAPQPATPAPEPAQPVSTPKATPKTVVTPVVETPTEAPVEEAPVEETPEEETPVEETPEETPAAEEAPEVPETAKEPESEESIKTKIITLLSVVAAIFAGIILLAVHRLYQIAKYEKIYKNALKRSHEVRKSGITRAG